jgi:hypothetical protein
MPRCDKCHYNTQYPDEEVRLPPRPAFYCGGLATFGDREPLGMPEHWAADVRTWIRSNSFNPKGMPVGRPSDCPGHSTPTKEN